MVQKVEEVDGDTDVTTQIAGLHMLFYLGKTNWKMFKNQSIMVIVLQEMGPFGCSDFMIATKQWIGMAGPAMIEGGGLESMIPRNRSC